MRSAKPVKRVLLGLLVLCILLAGGWYLLTPFPIGKAMHADEPFSLRRRFRHGKSHHRKRDL